MFKHVATSGTFKHMVTFGLFEHVAISDIHSLATRNYKFQHEASSGMF
jgi:hypothetical protein